MVALYSNSFSLEQSTGEAIPFSIKGTRLFSFSSKNIEGTKEGFVPGISREESLRLNISGNLNDTQIDANFFSSSTIGDISSKEETVSIRLKNDLFEAFLGDFTPDSYGLEFTNLDKVLSGLSVKGNYKIGGSTAETGSFEIIASSPKGISREKKLYGDGTQGPFYIDSPPIVINSEKVFLDNILQARGDDYDIDYSAGTITFKNKTIQKISVIEIRYESRETMYKHSTYVARLGYEKAGLFRARGSYIDDSDNVENQVFSSSTTEPQSAKIFGLDGELDLGPLLRLKGEGGYSERSTKLISNPQEKETGKAGKVEISSNLGPLSLFGKHKRIGTNFYQISDPLPKTDVHESLLSVKYDPYSFLSSEILLEENKFTQSGEKQNNETRRGSVLIRPIQDLSLKYSLLDFIESNDPVTALKIERITRRDSVDIEKSFNLLKTYISAYKEKRDDSLPSKEATTFNVINSGGSFSYNELISSSLNVELKDTEYSYKKNSSRKNYNGNISSSPIKQLFLNGSVNYIEDSEDGNSQIADISFKAVPINEIKTSGKYTISSIKETFNGSLEGIRKEEGFLSVELRPLSFLRGRYYVKPNFKVLNSTGSVFYNNSSNLFETNLFMFKDTTVLGYSLQKNTGFNVDKTDYPYFRRKQNSLDEDISIYSIKSAPLSFLSLELDYTEDKSSSLSLVSSAEPVSYVEEKGLLKKLSLSAKTSLTQKIAIDTSASYSTSDKSSQEPFAETEKTKSVSLSSKLILNIFPSLTVSPMYSYTETINFLVKENRETYTMAPGLELIFKPLPQTRIDASVSYSKSFAGSSTEKTISKVRGKHEIFNTIFIVLNFYSDISKNPDYKATEFSGNIEISL